MSVRNSFLISCPSSRSKWSRDRLGRGRDGSLLSSEDLEILRTVSGYIAVAIENGKLYQEQRAQTEELALLKEFNESIVESVNVGLLAVDEDGCIIRCNSTFEEMMGLGREQVVGKPSSRSLMRRSRRI